MLSIDIPGKELYNEMTGEFSYSKPVSLVLEHSLISVSKWEAKWHKPFLTMEEKTEEEFLDYIRCMTITPNVDPMVYLCLTNRNYAQIRAYMDDSMTATWFNEKDAGKNGKRIITSELIYCWMITLGIPDRFEKWHLNRLLTLIRVCNAENTPKKKMKPGDVLRQNSALNKARKSAHRSRG